MPRATVLLADDHTIVAQGVASLLQQEYDVVGLVDDGGKLVDEVRRLRPDVLVSDISMPNGSGLDALRRLKAARVSTRVVFLTMHGEAALAREAFRAGAAGFVLKQDAGEELLTAVRQALAGGTYLTPRVSPGELAALGATVPDAPKQITPRQHDVLRLVSEGRTSKEIAAALALSPRTVETHKYDMMHTLGVQTTGELIQYAFRHGLVH